MKFKLGISIAVALMLSGIVLVTAASAAHIIGNSAANTISGTNANDWIEGKGGNDLLFGLDNPGLERLQGGTGNDKVYGGRGSNDEITGGDGADRLYGGCNGACPAGWGIFFGGAGGDTIGADNGNPNDVVHGGDGDDTCFVDAGDEHDGCDKLVVDGDVIWDNIAPCACEEPTETGEEDIAWTRSREFQAS